MAQIKFVSGVKPGSRIVDTSRKLKKLDTGLIEKAFNARPAGSSRGLDLFGVREAMGRTLQSADGRPALVGSGRAYEDSQNRFGLGASDESGQLLAVPATDFVAFVRTLEKPSKPNAALKRLMQ